MKAKILSVLTAILAIVAVLGALDLSGLVSLVPGDNAAVLTYITGGLATLGTIIRAIGDMLDDGQANGSFGKLRCHPLALVLAGFLVALALGSCAQMRGLNLSLSSPWGDVSSIDGMTTISPKVIVIPAK